MNLNENVQSKKEDCRRREQKESRIQIKNSHLW